MAITYNIQPNPIWYLVDLVGKPLAPNGFIFTYSSLNFTIPKFAYQDEGGNFPWTNPIPIDENGTVKPIYWKFDSDNPGDLYYIRVCASNDPDDLVWDFNNIGAIGGSGGGSVTTALDLENLVTNNVMYRNIGTVSPVPTYVKIAPGAHTGLAQTASNRGPDICFVKNNTAAVDTISFPSFFGNNPLSPDVTPVEYCNYTCTNDPLGETDKYFLFPITQNVQNLTSQEVTVTIWAQLGSGGSASNVSLELRQFFGDGTGATGENNIPVASITLTSSWTKFGPYTVSIPNVSGKAIGGCHNDGLFLRFNMPLGLACNISFTKPALYLGNITPSQDYHTYDDLESQFNDARTGDIRTSVNDYQPFGWVAMSDGTIGNPSSGATSRAHFDTFPLYNQIWNSVSNSYAPVTGGRGATAVADFIANKPIALTRALGRVFAGALNTTISQTFTTNFSVSTSLLTVSSTTGIVTGFPLVLTTTGTLPAGLFPNVTYYAILVSGTTLRLASSLENSLAGTPVTFSSNGTGTHTLANAPYQTGRYTGEDFHTQTIAEMPSHNHPGSTVAAGIGPNPPYGFAEATQSNTHSVSVASQGGGQPFNIIQPTTYMNVYIKL